MIRVPAVDAHVHVDQVGEGDDAGGEEPGPVDVVVHVGGVQPGQQIVIIQDGGIRVPSLLMSDIQCPQFSGKKCR